MKASDASSILLSVILPVYNERDTLAEVVCQLRRLPYAMEVLIVDDGSDDGSTEQARQLASQDGVVNVILHDCNQGKGASIRTALQTASGDIIMIQDADLEYDPADIEILLRPLLKDRADVVYGSRFLPESRAKCLPARRAMNRLLTWLSNRFTGLELTDMETCYKAFRREVFAGMVLREDRFGFEPEFTAKIARGRWRVMEVPIRYAGRDHAAGKKIGFRDGLRALYCIVRYGWCD